MSFAVPILMDADQPLTELYERWWGSRATGEALKTFFALAKNPRSILEQCHTLGLAPAHRCCSIRAAIYTVAGEVEIAAVRPLMSPAGRANLSQSAAMSRVTIRSMIRSKSRHS